MFLMIPTTTVSLSTPSSTAVHDVRLDINFLGSPILGRESPFVNFITFRWLNNKVIRLSDSDAIHLREFRGPEYYEYTQSVSVHMNPWVKEIRILMLFQSNGKTGSITDIMYVDALKGAVTAPLITETLDIGPAVL